MQESQAIINSYSQPVHITLKQSASGKYYWEISIHGEDVEAVVNKIKQADTQLDSNWGAESHV